LDKMYMNNNSFIISADDSVLYNQIKGRNMIGYFIDSELKKVDVFGNGQTIYYPREEDGFLIGINETKCANMTIKIDSNKIKSITFFEQPVAVLLPSDEMPADGKKLEGFVYKAELRPTSVADLLPSKYPQLEVKPEEPAPKKEEEKAPTENTQTESTSPQSEPVESPKSDVKVLKAGRKAKSKED